jgi:hypothetical protein
MTSSSSHPLQTLPKELRNLLAGGLAGMLAKSFVAPIDRIKILYQVTSAQFRLRDVPRVARSIVEKEGWGALWKGNLATMIRVFPYRLVWCCSLEFIGWLMLQMFFSHIVASNILSCISIN